MNVYIYRGGDLNGCCDIRTLRIGWGWHVSMAAIESVISNFPAKLYINIYHNYIKSKQSLDWLRNSLDKTWSVFGTPPGQLLSQKL